MNIFNKVTLKGMKKSRTRTIVTIIGVILSAAMIIGVATFGVSLLGYMTKGAIQKEGDWHVEFENAPASFIKDRSNDKEVENIATFDDIGYAKLAESKNPDKPYLFLAGFNDKTFDTIPINLVSGRLPENNNEVVVSLAVSVNAGVTVNIGDTLSLEVGDRQDAETNLGQHDPFLANKEILKTREKKNYKVVGICQRPNFEEVTAPGYTIITKSNLENKASKQSAFIKLKNPHDIQDYVNNKAEKQAYNYNDHVLRFMGLSEDKLFNVLIYSIGGIVVAIIMIGSIFLIHNSFSISMNERTHQFGILSSIGATPKQLRNSVLFEGFVIGLIGIPIGTIVGLGGIKIVISVIEENFKGMFYKDVSLDMVISPLAILVAAVVSMITIIISAYIPARKAVKVPVIESIRQNSAVKINSKDVKTSKLMYKILGLEGTLASKNFKRNKKRYRSIVLSLVLSIILFISTNSFVKDLKEFSASTKVVTSYDIGLVASNVDDKEMLSFYNDMRDLPNVTESSYEAQGSYITSVNGNELSEEYFKSIGATSKDGTFDLTLKVLFINDKEYKSIVQKVGLSPEEYSGQNGRFIAAAKVGNDDKSVKGVTDLKDIFNSSSAELKISPKVGEVNSNSKKVNVKFVETVPPDSLPILTKNNSNWQEEKTGNYFVIMIPYSLKANYDAKPESVESKGLTFKTNDASKTEEAIKTALQKAGKSSSYTIINTNEAMSENRNMILIVNIFSYLFIVLISLIAVANVFNTISTNIKLRRRELAMLRSVGMSDKDFQKMMNFECVFYGMKALIIGVPLSIISSYGIYKCMFIGGAEGITYSFPWLSILISAVTVLFVVFITMLYSISKVKKENIIDVLRDDMN